MKPLAKSSGKPQKMDAVVVKKGLLELVFL